MPVALARARATRAPEATTHHAARPRRGRWRVPRDDRGSSSVEFTILFPIIVILLFGGPQLAMWYFARESAQAAAASAARAASVVSATPGDGKTAAESYLARVGSDTITGYRVTETDTATTVTIHIHVNVQSMVPLPGIDPSADVTVSRSKERFTTPDSP